MNSKNWPSLPIAEWGDTQATLNRWLQIVGKTRITLTPLLNHWWNATFYITARGLTTSTLHSGAIGFDAEFDFVDHVLRIRTSGTAEAELPLKSMSVANFYRKYFDALHGLGIDVTIHPTPNEIEDATPFPDDEAHASYDPEYAGRLHRILIDCDRVFSEHRARFIGKSSPVHFFWGSFDLALTRFSGRTAPEHPGGAPNCPARVMKEAYSHEVISAGFWPGRAGISDALFYAYAYPEPAGFSEAKVKPAGAFYQPEMKEFVLPYEAMRAAKSPDRALDEFLQSTYDAGATLAKWDRKTLER